MHYAPRDQPTTGPTFQESWKAAGNAAVVPTLLVAIISPEDGWRQ